MSRVTLWILWTLAPCAFGDAVHVSLEHADDGFFYRPASGAPAPESAAAPSDGWLTGLHLFTLRDPRQPALVRADHGPFTTRQSAPVPLPLEVANITDPVHFHATAPRVSAHLVTQEVTQERPVLRVLMAVAPGGGGGTRPHHRALCVTVMVSRGHELLTAHCQPDGNGVCLAEAILPAAWWPRRPAAAGKKPAKNQAAVSYLLSATGGQGDCAAGEAGLPSQPVTTVGVVPLTHGRESSKVYQLGKHVRLAVPHGPLYPKTRVYIPVFVVPSEEEPVFGFTLRARVRHGLQVLGAELASERWNISVTSSKRRGAVTVTAYGQTGLPQPPTGDAATADGAYEVFTLLLRVEEHPELREGGKVVWRLQNLSRGRGSAGDATGEQRRRKIVTQLNLQKDDTQMVLPMAKTTDLVNTAMLTGAQVTEPLRVFMVSQSGDVADVTLKSSCKSTDESVLKVSSSCTSVYLDGSEARGSQNATVIVDYGTYHGSASFRVWVPEEPLDIEIPDPKLSEIRGWKVRTPVPNKHPNDLTRLFTPTAAYTSDRQTCQLRYQQTPLEVYAKFVSRDDNSGRVSYVAGRKTSLRVTDLVKGHLRVADPQYATLRDNLLVGKAPGRTKVQLLSPITGAEVASREFRVAGDRVSVSALEAAIVSGLQLAVSRRAENEYAAVTSVTSRLTAQYQEGLLDLTLLFSDGTRTPLSAVEVSSYALDVDTQDPRVVALAPHTGQQPRVLAIGPGKGKLLKVKLEMDEACGKRRHEALATTYAHVEVQFAGQFLSEGIQNDASHLLDRPELYDGGRHGLQQVLEDARKAGKGGPLSVGTERHPRRSGHRLQPLEIGMFILLAVFCVVIAIFIAACFVYAGQVKRANKEGASGSRQSHANAQDWVWLGRSSLEHVATRSSCSQNQLAVSDMNANVDRFPPASRERDLHITVNPQQQAVAANTSQQRAQQQTVPVSTSQQRAQQQQAVPANTSQQRAQQQQRQQQQDQQQQREQERQQQEQQQQQQKRQRRKQQQQQKQVDSRTFVKGRSDQPMYQNVGCLYEEDGEDELPSESEDTSCAPPVPPHQTPTSAPPTDRQEAPFVRPAPRQAAVRRANVVENPLLRAKSEPEAREAASELGLGMDYDELMRYFDSLKESNA